MAALAGACMDHARHTHHAQYAHLALTPRHSAVRPAQLRGGRHSLHRPRGPGLALLPWGSLEALQEQQRVIHAHKRKKLSCVLMGAMPRL